MRNSTSEILAYRVTSRWDMKLSPASPDRYWMKQTTAGYANRCLPMRIASQAGWVVLNNQSLRAKWLGGAGPDRVVIEHTDDPLCPAISHFGEGILTFTIPFLFRTPRGTALLFRGPANAPKDSIAALEGLVETDWAVATASMNWKFTRTDAWVDFARGEPICMIVPVRLDQLENVQPRITDIESDPETSRNYESWRVSTKDFNQRLRERDPEAVALGWQRYYMRGTAPHACPGPIPEAEEHRTRLVLKQFIDSTLDCPPRHGTQVNA
jgi:hypothetical protein